MRTSSKPPTIIGDAANLTKALSMLIIVLLVAFWFVGDDMGWKSTPQPSMYEVEKQYISDQNWTYIKYAMWALVLIALTSCCALLVARIAAEIRRTWLGSNIINGSLVIDNYSYRDRHGELNRDTAITDLDKQIDPTVRIHRNGTQQLTTQGHSDPNVQAQITTKVMHQRAADRQAERERRNSFISGGGKNAQPVKMTAAQMKAKFEDEAGVNAAKARIFEARAAKAELSLSMAQQRALPMPSAEPQDEPKFAIEHVPFQQALLQPNADIAWVGQNQETGRIAKWDFTKLSHLRVHGSTNSGKSQMLRHICAQLAAKKHQMVFLDNSSLIDCELFRYTAQLIDCKNPEVLLSCLSEIWAIVEERERLVVDHVGVTDDRKYASLPKDIKRKHPRLFVVLDEWADHIANAVDAGLDEEIIRFVDRLAAKARKCGVHLIMADQKPDSEAWSTKIKQNVQAVLSGPLNSNIASSVYGKPMPKITEPFVMAFSDGDQLVKGFFDLTELERMYKQTKANFQPPVHIDISRTVNRIEQRESASEVIPQNSDKLSQVVDYQLANPDASKNDVMDACECSASTVAKARRIIKDAV